MTLRRWLGAAAVFAAAAAAGCGGSNAAYKPQGGEARQALEAALGAWQKGSKPDQLAAATPPVHAVDSEWEAGQALEGFEVLDDGVAGEGDNASSRTFSVKLKRKKGETTTHYVVVGRAPVWVYREEDYARLLNMDDKPKSKAAPKAGTGRKGRG